MTYYLVDGFGNYMDFTLQPQDGAIVCTRSYDYEEFKYIQFYYLSKYIGMTRDYTSIGYDEYYRICFGRNVRQQINSFLIDNSLYSFLDSETSTPESLGNVSLV